jgi:toxin ParE1/3/4
MKVVLTDEARADLVRIADWIARDNPRRAVTFIDELEAHRARIPKTPRAYPLVPGHEEIGLRRAVHGTI